MVIPYDGRSDILIRFQRDVNAGMTAEVWNIDGSGYARYSNEFTPTNPSNGAGLNAIGDPSIIGQFLDIDWMRWYSSLVPVGGNPPSNAVSGGDLGDWELDGNGADQSGNALAVSIANSYSSADQKGNAVNAPVGNTYSATPTYPPVAQAGVVGASNVLPDAALRAGYPAQLDASGSYSLVDSQQLTYSWRQTAGPVTLLFSDPTAVNPTITGMIFGEYTIQLTVQDSTGQSSTANLEISAVATDDNGVVIQADPNIDFVFGPMMRFGANPWQWADVNQRNMALGYGADLNTPAPGWGAQWRDYLNGTVSTTAGSVTVNGAGTNFQADFCGGASSPTQNAQVVVYAPDGTKAAFDVASCQSATQLKLQPYEANRTGDLTGSPYAKMDVLTPIFWGWAWNGSGGSNNSDYYDSVLAYYNLYYRSGKTEYRDMARTLAARWADSPWFAAGPYPRMWGLNGVLLNTYEQNPKQWSKLEAILDSQLGLMNGNSPLGDNREEGYLVSYFSLAAQMDPNPDKSAAYKQAILADETNRWAPNRQPGGYSLQDICDWAWDCNGYDQLNFGATVTNGSRKAVATAQTGTVNVANGSTQVTGNGTRLATQLCRGGTTPPHLGGVAGESIVFWSGAGYIVGAVASCQDENHVTLQNPYPGPSESGMSWSLSWPYWTQTTQGGGYWYPQTLALTNGSTTATLNGSGVDIAQVACGTEGPPTAYSSLLLRTDAPRDWNFGFIEVSNCDSSTQLSLAQPWNGATGNYSFQQPATNIWFRDDGDQVGYQASFLDPVTAILDRPYAGISRNTATFRYGGGKLVQPFMLGIQTTAWAWAYKVTQDPTIRTWIIENAQWLRDWGYWHGTQGLYYFRLGPGCEPNPAHFLWCTGGGMVGDVDSVYNSRFLSGEVMNALSQAYLLSGDDGVKGVMDTMYSACLGRAGYGGNLDQNYCKELQEVEDGSKAKDFGYFYGMGNAASWPAARIAGGQLPHVEVATVAIDMTSAPGAVSAQVTVTQPSGASSVTTCGGGSCAISIDARQGAHWYQVAFLDASGKVIAQSTPDLIVAGQTSHRVTANRTGQFTRNSGGSPRERP